MLPSQLLARRCNDVGGRGGVAVGGDAAAAAAGGVASAAEAAVLASVAASRSFLSAASCLRVCSICAASGDCAGASPLGGYLRTRAQRAAAALSSSPSAAFNASLHCLIGLPVRACNDLICANEARFARAAGQVAAVQAFATLRKPLASAASQA